MKPNQNTSGLNSQLKEVKREVFTAVSGSVVLIDHLKELSLSLRDETNLGSV